MINTLLLKTPFCFSIKKGYLKNQTIEALSQTVGFANRNSFYRVFKSITGHSPTDY